MQAYRSQLKDRPPEERLVTVRHSPALIAKGDPIDGSRAGIRGCLGAFRYLDQRIDFPSRRMFAYPAQACRRTTPGGGNHARRESRGIHPRPCDRLLGILLPARDRRSRHCRRPGRCPADSRSAGRENWHQCRCPAPHPAATGRTRHLHAGGRPVRAQLRIATAAFGFTTVAAWPGPHDGPGLPLGLLSGNDP